MESILNKSIKYLPLGSALMILLGVFDSICYFSVFGISILDYIDLAEAVLLSVGHMDILITFVFTLLLTKGLDSYLSPKKISNNDKEGNRLKRLVLPFVLFNMILYLIANFFLVFEARLLPIFMN